MNVDTNTLPTSDACITGVTDTICLVDYVRCTFPVNTSALYEAQRLFGQARSWRQGAGGRFGFRCNSRRDKIILYHSEDGERVCAEMSGEACRQLERDQGFSEAWGWREFLSELTDIGCTFARLDWALDDTVGNLDMAVIVACVDAGQCVSRSRTVNVQQTQRTVNAAPVGAGIALGSRKSDIYIRIYDRLLREKARGRATNYVGHVRVEIEAKNGQADAMARAFITGGADAIQRDLRARLDFKEKPAGKDTNRSRWQTCEWWGRFLSACSKARVETVAEPKTLAGIAMQLEVQYGTWLATLMDAPNYGERWLQRVLANGRARREQKHFDLLRRDS